MMSLLNGLLILTNYLKYYLKNIHRHINHKLTSSTSTFETEQKQLSVGTYVIHKNFKPVHFSDKLKPLRVGPFKITRHLSTVTYELLTKTGETFITHRNHLIAFYPKEPFIFPYIQDYKLLTPSLINNPDNFSYQDDLSDDELSSQPPSPQPDFNDLDMSKFSSNYDDSQYDMQENPLYISSQSQPDNQIQIYPRVGDTNHSFFPQSNPFDDNSLRHNRTPYNLRNLPHTNYSKTRYSFPPD